MKIFSAKLSCFNTYNNSKQQLQFMNTVNSVFYLNEKLDRSYQCSYIKAFSFQENMVVSKKFYSPVEQVFGKHYVKC